MNAKREKTDENYSTKINDRNCFTDLGQHLDLWVVSTNSRAQEISTKNKESKKQNSWIKMKTICFAKWFYFQKYGLYSVYLRHKKEDKRFTLNLLKEITFS